MKVRSLMSIVLLVYWLVACSGPQARYTRANHNPSPYLSELGLLDKTIIYRSRPLSIATINHVALALFKNQYAIGPVVVDTQNEDTKDDNMGDKVAIQPHQPKRASKPAPLQRLTNVDMARVLERYFTQVSALPEGIADRSLALQKAKMLNAEFLIMVEPLREVNRHQGRHQSSYLSKLNPLMLLKNSHIQMRVVVFDVTTGKIVDNATIAARTGMLNNRQAFNGFGEKALTAYVEQLTYQPSQRTVY